MRRCSKSSASASFGASCQVFRDVRIVPERFPVTSRLHGGWKGAIYQRAVRRDVQCAAAAAGSPLRLAPHRVLPQMIPFTKAHAYGNDFLYVLDADVVRAARRSLARELCDRHAGIGADGLIVRTRTGAGATMRLFNADGSRAEVSGQRRPRPRARLLLRDDERVGATVTIRERERARSS